MNSNIKWIAGIVGAGMVAAGLVVWFVLLSGPSATPTQTTVTTSFGTSNTRTTTSVAQNTDTNTGEPVVSSGVSASKIFKVADGPVAGATLLVTTRPTSTIARFVLAQNGHIMDLLLDTPGAVAKAVSNTTIPGIVQAVWSEGGRGALLQYMDASALKTAHFALPNPAATTTAPVRVQFLPAGVSNVSVSPDGASIAYLVKTSAGANGYTAKADGVGAKKLFSLPLSQINLSWPSTNVLLAQSAPASGIPGVVFSVDAKTGGVSPLLYATGVTATADRSFSKIIYQSADTSRNTYVRDSKTGLSKKLSFNPFPEKCVWGKASSITLYCAAPLQGTPVNYLDLWHQGVSSAPDTIYSFSLDTNVGKILVIPGSSDGGVPTDIAEIAVSPDDHYLLFISKGDRSLWAVRLPDR